MSNTSKWEEQWKRVNRWYDRFRAINDGRPHDEESDYYRDDVYAFFLNCYHMKDWIKNDQTVGEVRHKVEDLVKNSHELSLCGDICNSIKHLTLTKTKSGKPPQFGPRHHKLGLGTGPPTIAINYEIRTATGPIDAFELATKCMKAWESFIKSNVALSP